MKYLKKNKGILPKIKTLIHKTVKRNTKAGTIIDDIAVIGMAGRFPNSDNTAEFWENLSEGKDLIKEVPRDRWDIKEIFDPNAEGFGKTYSKWGGFVNDIDKFDAPFFKIFPAEAEKMDPQQRISLQEAYKTIEDSGYSLDELSKNKVGVFVAARTGDYRDQSLCQQENMEFFTLLGTDTSILSGRISHHLNLKGPNISINTACSSVGISIHLACQSIKLGESEIALAGGVYFMTTPQRFIFHSQTGLLSRDGKYRAFDDQSNGFVLGEAVGFVLLKPLKRAIEDRDNIYGVIKATGVHHSGISKDLTVPDLVSHVDLVKEVIKNSRVDPATVDYVEAHGSGTRKGDAREIECLVKAYQNDSGTDQKDLSFGSVKPTVGYPMVASVLPGLFKILLSFKHRKIPPTINCEKYNSLVDKSEYQFSIVNKTKLWDPGKKTPRRAGLNALSYNGANFHMILEEPPVIERSSHKIKPEESYFLVPISAKTTITLREVLVDLKFYLERDEKKVCLADIAFTLGVGREHYENRISFVVKSINDLKARIDDILQLHNDEITLTKNKLPYSDAEVEDLSEETGAQKIFKKNYLKKLQEAYQSGCNIKWSLLYEKKRCNRISLPSYPFQKLKFLYNVGKNGNPNNNSGRPENKINSKNKGVNQYETILVFAKKDRFFQAIKTEIEHDKLLSPNILLIKPGRFFKQLGELIYQINPTETSDYRSLINTIQPQLQGKTLVLYLWGYGGENVDYRYYYDFRQLMAEIKQSAAASTGSIARFADALKKNRNTDQILLFNILKDEPENPQPQHIATPSSEGSKHLSVTNIYLTELLDNQNKLSQVLMPLLDSDTKAAEGNIFSKGSKDNIKNWQNYIKTTGYQVNGNYLIINNPTGTGFQIAADLIDNTKCRIMLLDDPSRHSKAINLNYPAKKYEYHNCDVSNLDQLKQQVDNIVQNDKMITAVIYCLEPQFAYYENQNLYGPLVVDEATKDFQINTFSLVIPHQDSGSLNSVHNLEDYAFKLTTIRNGLLKRRKMNATTEIVFYDKQAEKMTDQSQQAERSIKAKIDTGNAIENEIKLFLSFLLKIDEDSIDLDASTDELGLGSVLLTRLSSHINSKYELDLSPSQFYKYQTIKEFCDDLLIPKYDQPSIEEEHVDQSTEKEYAEANHPVTINEEPTEENQRQIDNKNFHHAQNDRDVAIIGMSAVLPQSDNVEDLWQNLIDNKNLISEIPKSRWNWRDYYGDSNKEVNKTQAKYGGFINDFKKFDAAFFNISPREAILMDPQQRLLLENVWNCIEDAGYNASDLAGSNTGIFLGVSNMDFYGLMRRQDLAVEAYSSTGTCHSITANRLSYIFDFNGPNETVDTACSSSLIAIHRSVEAIRNGTCGLAVAGGSNIILDPFLHLSFSKAGMLSSDGKCKAFDQSANGYVRSEGTGVILLKPMRQAVEDNDHIYGVIKGSAVNHGGKANSLTAPNTRAQARVIMDAYRDANLDPSTTSYIEAHGTGTSLGDPIEINGLEKAFSTLLSENKKEETRKPYCGVGTIKTNVGHLELAAGIAGVIKVLLAMKYKTIPGILHFEKLNPYIKLNDSHFFIETKNRAWSKLTNEKGDEVPRRASVSSFGFGGANAHILLEEYEEKTEPVQSSQADTIALVLSAKTEKQLKQYAGKVVDFINRSVTNNNPMPSLTDFAYTFQIGRQSMKARLAVIVASFEELVEKLQQYLQTNSYIENVFTGIVKNVKKTDQKGEKNIQKDHYRNDINLKSNLIELSKQYVTGDPVNWMSLYSKTRPKRISAPTYPFEEKRYWVFEEKQSLFKTFEQKGNEFRFKKRLFEDEFYVRDHIVYDKMLLPGVFSFELVNAASRMAKQGDIVGLNNIVWTSPVEIKKDQQADIEIILNLTKEKKTFNIINHSDNNQKRTHCQGNIQFADQSDKGHQDETLDLKAIIDRCPNFEEGVNCYTRFKEVGLAYGKSFQVISKLFFNQQEALSFLQLPQGLQSDDQDLSIHPSLMDGALQTIMGITHLSDQSSHKLYLPYMAKELAVFNRLPSKCYAYARFSKNQSANSRISTFDIYVSDTNGQIVAKLDEFMVYEYSAKHTENKSDVIYVKDQWEETTDVVSDSFVQNGTIVVFAENETTFQMLNDRFVDTNGIKPNVIFVQPGLEYQQFAPDRFNIRIDFPDDYNRLIQDLVNSQFKPTVIIDLLAYSTKNPENYLIPNVIKERYLSLYFLTQALVDNKIKEEVRFLYFYSENKFWPLHSAITGFAKTTQREIPNYRYKVIRIATVPDMNHSIDQMVDIVHSELGQPFGNTKEIKYENGNRYHSVLKEFAVQPATPQNLLFRSKGVYIITGGLGKLGVIFAEYLARKTECSIVLTGSGNLDEAKRKNIEKLTKLGAVTQYVKADISKREDVEHLIQTVKKQFAVVHGVIHSAGIIKDALVKNKNAQDIQTVIIPKILGAIYLDEALKSEPLDFFVFFSSLSAVIGNAGQSDYGFANRFMDQFAKYRESLRLNNRRKGRTISIGWPFWQDGGMKIDEQSTKLIAKTMGLHTMPTPIGLKAFEEGICSEEAYFAVFFGEGDKIKLKFDIFREKTEMNSDFSLTGNSSTAKNKNMYNGALFEELREELLQMIGGILSTDSSEFDIDDDLSEHGFDSITLTELANRVNEKYDLELTPPVFFEYSSISSFAKYLLEKIDGAVQADGANQIMPQQQNGEKNPMIMTERNELDSDHSNGNADETIGLLQDELINQTSEILKIDVSDIAKEDDLSTLGFDSITLTELVNSINDTYDMELTPPIFFEYTSISAIAEYLHGHHQVRPNLATNTKSPRFSLDSGSNISPEKTLIQTVNSNSNAFAKKTLVNPPTVNTGFDQPTAPHIPENDQMIAADRWIDNDHVERKKYVDNTSEPIAVIGINGVMPKSEDLDEFWKNLVDEKDLISKIPSDRWNWKDVHGDPAREINKTDITWGGFIKDVDKFDEEFFGISPKEAEAMDPQQRIFLEVVWKTIENAGYNPDDLSGTKTGLFVGISDVDYQELYLDYNLDKEAYAAIGMARCILANRISYLMNWHGPSEPVDTACSSSLVAIHRAVQAIRNNECDMAIAGGVNTIITPTLHIAFSKGGMLSEDGRCKTFDASANGYVRGEGAGAILLKPLTKAIEDNDIIYTLIKGTAVNHGGKSSSLTAPNPIAQADLLTTAYKNADIDPLTVSYIEAHGTGTPLGDPIEINGLKKAFREFDKKAGRNGTAKSYCGIGSVKTNIGHLESAAGIAGVLKIILAMKNKTIPASLHCKELNPYIQISDSPFYITQKTTPWEPIHPIEKNRIPRRAGISSFGFGGVNAHLVLEDYEQDNPESSDQKINTHLIVLSAKSKERLREYAQKLKDYLVNERSHFDDDSQFLSRVAYTLQVGRIQLNNRIAILTDNLDKLIDRLNHFVTDDKAIIKDTFLSASRIEREENKRFQFLLEGEEGEAYLNVLIKNKKTSKLAKLWIQGIDIDWKLIHSDNKKKRLALPTYPFAKNRHWIRKIENQNSHKSIYRPVSNRIHPLIDSNVSTIDAFQFEKMLSEDDFFIKDHVVGDYKVLPAVAYLEWAFAAATLLSDKKVTALKNVSWLKPLIITDSDVSYKIQLKAVDNKLKYHIFENGRNPEVIYGKGEIIIKDTADNTVAERKKYDLESIDKKCQSKLDSKVIYDTFHEVGLKYGSGFQTIRTLKYNEKEAIGQIELANDLKNKPGDFYFHPSLMDGALQTILGLAMSNQNSSGILYLPYKLGSMEIYSQVSQPCFAYVKTVNTDSENDSGVKTFTVSILDKDGHEQVKLKNFTLKMTKKSLFVKKADKKEQFKTLIFEKIYEPSQLTLKKRTANKSLKLLLFDQNDHLKKALATISKNGDQDLIKTVWAKPGKTFKRISTNAYELNHKISEDYQHLIKALSMEKEGLANIVINRSFETQTSENKLDQGIYTLFYLIKALVKEKVKENIDITFCYTVPEDNDVPEYAALTGFSRSVRFENPNIHIKVIKIQSLNDQAGDKESPNNAQLILNELQSANTTEVEVVYQDNRRNVGCLMPMKTTEAQKSGSYIKPNGVYLVTGGAGGLGFAVADHIAQKEKLKLILTGRTPENKKIRNQLEQLKAHGASAAYIQANIAQEDEIVSLNSSIESRFGQLDGIFHCAGVHRDEFLVKKSKVQIDAVLKSKIHGVLNLFNVIDTEQLDFVVLFSSIVSELGNPGQTDYAFGNAFMDHLTRQKQSKVKSINWPLWKDGGMQLKESAKEYLINEKGLDVLDTRSGLQIMDTCMGLKSKQIFVIRGGEENITRLIEHQNDGLSQTGNEGVDGRSNNEKELLPSISSESFIKEIVGIVGKILEVDFLTVNLEKDLESYGMDSLMTLKMIRKINRKWKINVMAAELIDYRNLRSLTKYLYETYIVSEKLKPKDRQPDDKFVDIQEQQEEKLSIQETDIIKSIQDKSDVEELSEGIIDRLLIEKLGKVKENERY